MTTILRRILLVWLTTFRPRKLEIMARRPGDRERENHSSQRLMNVTSPRAAFYAFLTAIKRDTSLNTESNRISEGEGALWCHYRGRQKCHRNHFLIK